eukprot:gnl/Carplike_NY0171/677_a937_657.p1 GENE.gnl/Carplike_NY0171/677_a937_657~~gnl/Carplike_NY0171/677_a937_657.p1  ORF type:complete len:324 (-),score=16.26 gnl/Carplike_NY0171/677_a937_657:632-1603(-)
MAGSKVKSKKDFLLKPPEDIIGWLLEGDPSIQFQTCRDLLDNSENLETMQEKMAVSGWGKNLLDAFGADDKWGGGFYSPKWISTHYTLMLLMRMGFPQSHEIPRRALQKYLDAMWYEDGGINVGVTSKSSDVCVTGMVLSLLCYFGFDDQRMVGMIDYFKARRLADGGWNCNYSGGDYHSSVHTTLSVLDGLERMKVYCPNRKADLEDLTQSGMKFLLDHKLYKSHTSGEVMKDSFTRFSFPPRWFFDVMKALDQFQTHGLSYDEGMRDALELLLSKQTSTGKWRVQNKHAGRTHFEMEKTGAESRWNTLRAYRILKAYGGDL